MPEFNPFLEFIYDEPKAAYFSRADQFGGPNNYRPQQNYYQNQFSNIYNRYLGDLGMQARSGIQPQGEFNDFLGTFDFNKHYRENVPYETRQPGLSAFVPRMQWQVPGINDQRLR
jgi:hypothetical protein